MYGKSSRIPFRRASCCRNGNTGTVNAGKVETPKGGTFPWRYDIYATPLWQNLKFPAQVKNKFTPAARWTVRNTISHGVLGENQPPLSRELLRDLKMRAAVPVVLWDSPQQQATLPVA